MTCIAQGAIMPLDAPLTAVLTLPLGSPRLVLRRFALADADAFATCRSDPLVARYQDWESSSRAEAAAFI